VKREASESGSRKNSSRRSRSRKVKKEEGDEDDDGVKKEVKDEDKSEDKDEFRKITVETTWPELIRILDLAQVPAYLDGLDSQAGRGERLQYRRNSRRNIIYITSASIGRNTVICFDIMFISSQRVARYLEIRSRKISSKNITSKKILVRKETKRK
jgi:hypothetical protein